VTWQAQGGGLPQILGRYALYGEIASGGMATVHFGRLLGPVGFSRTVAIKRLHPQFAKDPEFVSMFLDEARVAARVQHPNVVSTLDVVATEGELVLVMEYVEGEALSKILRQIRASRALIPPRIVGSIVTGLLHGLHAAHEAKTERGDPLNIIHRDVSPQNVLVGVDGVSRVLDFGVAKAAGRMQLTREGQLKGKLAYMAPEQIAGEELDRRADVYAAGVVLWESLACRRLFDGENEGAILQKIIRGEVPPPSRFVPELPRAVDEICLRALARDREDRFRSALEMAVLLEQALGTEPNWRVGAFVQSCAHEALSARYAAVKEMENVSTEVDGQIQPFTGSTPSVAPPRKKRNPIVWALASLLLVSLATTVTLLVMAYTEEAPTAAVPVASLSSAPPGPVPSVVVSQATPAGTPSALATSSASVTPSVVSIPVALPRPPSDKLGGARSAGGEPSPPDKLGGARSAGGEPSPPDKSGAPIPKVEPSVAPKTDCFYVENGIKKIRPSCLQ
jgi:eukaryotic-like serine/threonine-protein kinase